MNIINFLHPVLWIKILTLFLIVFYAIFTFVVFTQVKVMSRVLFIPRAEEIFKMISIIHIVLAVSLFLFALVIL